MCPMSHKSIALVADQLASILKSPPRSEFCSTIGVNGTY